MKDTDEAAMKAARDKYMTVEQADGTAYLDVDHNCEVSFDAGWKARDAVLEQPAPFTALLEYARAEERFNLVMGKCAKCISFATRCDKHDREWRELGQQRLEALALCEGIR